eukprot:Gregarina_sp_Poly_1__110@NODE_1023_length_5325_cov_19_407950_g713_i0_p3_GENE_NODE_1023_length_5325_cov_19_407950_g713_i0NODE_1023_length_5325_cov_19_407950_g713_i0_p3_ORF_typecomplete_len110_score1_92Furinlike_2/PF15913_5/0_46Furinlike/PF00757_20/0_73_NODE_1023_length_5325_cov_19_407950_g713_i013731702
MLSFPFKMHIPRIRGTSTSTSQKRQGSVRLKSNSRCGENTVEGIFSDTRTKGCTRKRNWKLQYMLDGSPGKGCLRCKHYYSESAGRCVSACCPGEKMVVVGQMCVSCVP